jgi:DNA (cytosine-5)-methyltransferase 1
MKKLKIVDLFSGCGGFSYGFEQAGFDVVAGIDFDANALKTFELNHNNAKGYLMDLFKEETIDEIIQNVGEKIDGIIAGPPCQGFSLTGTRNEDDKRNKLFYSVFHLTERLKPKFIVIENVPGIARLYNGKVRDEIYRLSEEMGYYVTFKEVFAPDYGVPQIRKRAFFVCIKKEYKDFQFPEHTHKPENYVTTSDAIGDLPSLENSIGFEECSYEEKPKTDYQKLMRVSKKLFNHVGTIHSDLVKSVISLVPEGGNHKDLPEGVGDSRKFNEAWTRYHSKKPSKTIDTGHRNHFHYKWDRVPTVRENARLQSFPDNFVFVGNKTSQYRQVGNAVPPLLGKIIGESILKHINEI